MTDIRLFDLNLLVAFDAMMAERSVTRAGQRIHIGQPAMSYTLARLRELFRDDLFIRVTGQMQPTSRALELAGPISRILGDIRSNVLASRDFRPDAAEVTIKLGTTDYADVAVLPALLGEVRSSAPRARVRVNSLHGSAITPMLEDGAIDVAIGYCSRPIGRASQNSEFLFREDFVCLFDGEACGATSPLDLDSYFALPHIVMAPCDESTRWACQSIAYRDIFALVTTPHTLTIPSLLRGLRAVASVPRRLAESWADVTGLEVSPPPLTLPGFDVSMHWHLRTETDPAQRWFRDLIRRAGSVKPSDPRRTRNTKKPKRR